MIRNADEEFVDSLNNFMISVGYEGPIIDGVYSFQSASLSSRGCVKVIDKVKIFIGKDKKSYDIIFNLHGLNTVIYLYMSHYDFVQVTNRVELSASEIPILLHDLLEQSGQ